MNSESQANVQSLQAAISGSLRRHSIRALALVLVLLMSGGGSFAYSVLTHEEIVDLLWSDEIRPLLLKRFPDLSDDQLKEAKIKILHFPTVLGAVIPIYNVSGVSGELNFTQKALAGIYLGTITKWNDPEIAGANSGVNLPATDIVVVHRADGSGTSYIWTDFLSKISDDWKNKVGKGTSVQWPVGLGGKGNEGVAGLVKQTPSSIGYVELIYAVQNNITFGKVQNASGKFLKADLAGVTAAAAAAKDMPDDFRVSITNEPGPTVYPISSFTWLLIPAQISDAAKRDAIKGFLKWMLTEGQGYNEGLAYARLPKPVIEKELKAISLIQ